MRRTLTLVTAVAAALAAGCSDKPKLAPVRGQVKMDGKPLANVMVTFQPIAQKGENAGPGSAGVTDDQGRYTLKVSSQQMEGDGAVVGEHRVAIGVILEGEGKKPTDPSVGTPDGATPEDIQAMKRRERIPERYNQNSELRFTVKPGDNEANFDLKSK